MKTHTPLPWKFYHETFRKEISDMKVTEIQDASGNAIVRWPGFDGVPQSKKEMLANARFIVTACNNHEALVEACEEMIAALNGTYIDDRQRAIEHMKAALARVREGK
jgi:hypothetical protein